jgi:uracil phosphoribosyltransferase
MDYGQNDELLQRARLLKDDRKFNSNERKKLGNLSIFKENKNGMNPNTVASVVQGSSLVSIHGRPLKVMRGAALLINDVVYYVKSITEGHLEIDRDYEGCTDSEAKVSMNPKEVDHSVLLEPMLPSPEQISQAVEGLDRIAEMFHGLVTAVNFGFWMAII